MAIPKSPEYGKGASYQCKDGAACEHRLFNPPKRQRK